MTRLTLRREERVTVQGGSVVKLSKKKIFLKKKFFTQFQTE